MVARIAPIFLVSLALALSLCSAASNSISQVPADCEKFAETHPGFAELIGATVEYEDIYGSLFKVGICTDLFDCGNCNGGGKAGYCEVWLGKKRDEEATHDADEKEGNCIGKFAAATAITVGSDTGIELSYDRGEFSSKGTLQMFCSPEAGKFSDVKTLDLSGKRMSLKSALVCSGGGSGGISPGTVFCILLLFLALGYLVGGVLYNKFIKNVDNGLDLLPHLEFWMDLPSMIKEGCMFIYDKFMTITNLKSGSDF